MLEKTRKNIKWLGISTLAAGVGLSVFWILLLLLCRDETAPGYFVPGAVGFTVFVVLLLLCAAALVVSAFFLEGAAPAAEKGVDPIAFFASVGCGFLLLAYAVILGVVRVGAAAETAVFFYILAIVLAVPSALGFFLCQAPEVFLRPAIRKILSVIADSTMIFFCFVYFFACYLDRDLPINSPVKCMDQVFFVVYAVFTLASMGQRIGKVAYRVLLPLSAAAAILGFCNGFGGIAVYLQSGTETVLRDSVLHDFLQLLLGMYAGSFLLSAVRGARSRQSRILSQVTAQAEATVPEKTEGSAPPKEMRRPGERDRGDTDGVSYGQQTIPFPIGTDFDPKNKNENDRKK